MAKRVNIRTRKERDPEVVKKWNQTSQQKWQDKLQAAAIRDGFKDGETLARSQALAAWANGEYRLVKPVV